MSSTDTELSPDTNLDATPTDVSVESQPDAASASSSSPEVDSAPAPAAVTPANPEGAGDGSLTTGAETQIPADSAQAVMKQQAAAQPPVDWKKRHDGQFQANQRLSNELKQIRQEADQLKQFRQQFEQQFAGYEPQKWQQFVKHQEVEHLPPWHPKSPKKAQFDALQATAEHHERIVARSQTPEERAWALRNYAADVAPEQEELLKQFRNQGRQKLLNLQMNPEGFIHDLVAPMLEQRLQGWQQNTVQSYQQAQQGRGEVEQWIQQNPQVATKENLQKAHDLMGQGWPFKAAAAQVERDHYYGLVSAAELKNRSAEEKHRLLQANASVDRDPASNHKINLFEETKKVAKQRGINNPLDPRLLRITDELRKKHNIKG